MNLSYKKGLSLILVIAFIMTTMMMPGLSAEETSVKISRTDVAELAVKNSASLMEIQTEVEKLVDSYANLKNGTKMLGDMFDDYPEYEELYEKYQEASDDFKVYLNLIVSSDANNQLKALRMIDEVNTGETAGEPATNLINSEETILKNEVEDDNSISIDEYITYLTLSAQYAAMGYNQPNLSNKDKFTTFVKPSDITTKELFTAKENLKIQKSVVEKSISAGATSLYDSILQMEGVLELIQLSYDMALIDYSVANVKKANGQISDVNFRTIENELEIAKLKRDNMKRTVDNMKMQLNVMIGFDVNTEIELFTPLVNIDELESIDNYINLGLNNRSEVLIAQNNYDSKVYIFEQVDKYFSPANFEYRTAKHELEIAEIVLENTKYDVEINIHQSYANYINKMLAFENKKLELEDAEETYSNMLLNKELGFLNDISFQGIVTMKESATNEYFQAYREFMAARTSLDNSVEVGPAFSESAGLLNGGTTNE